MAKNINEPLERIQLPNFGDRQIYDSAITMSADPQAVFPGYAVPRAGRRIVKSKTKTSNIVLSLIGLAVIAVLYTHNVIMVNSLVREVSDLNAKYVSILSINEVLKSEVARKESLERISLIAQSKLGMMNPKEQPVFFIVPQENIQSVQEQLREQ
ncbi:MAG: septum formation initiator family protein [Bacteroidetes bacterium]|nr:septum formation initiator family protein [Bacteroidota bacterium]